MEAVRSAATTFQHVRSVGPWSDANENMLPYTPRLRHSIGPQIALKLVIYDAGGHQQCQFAQPGKFMLLCKQRGLVFRRRRPTRKTFQSGSIHNHDLVGKTIQKSARNAARGAIASDAFDFVAEFFEVLQVDGGDD